MGFKFDSYCDSETRAYFEYKDYFKQGGFVLIKKTYFKYLKYFLINLILKNINEKNYYSEDLIYKYLQDTNHKGKILYTLKTIKKLIISIQITKRKIVFFGKTFKF